MGSFGGNLAVSGFANVGAVAGAFTAVAVMLKRAARRAERIAHDG